jgi:glycosyltransferase involved in cell wall biosynthesis
VARNRTRLIRAGGDPGLKLALFTNRFPSRVSTFFARDVRSLLDAGVHVDVFPIYPVKRALWRWVPEVLGESRFPRDRVHSPRGADLMRCLGARGMSHIPALMSEARGILGSAAGFGLRPVAKSSLAIVCGWAWAVRFGSAYDHILSYWGNYAATYAHVAHRLAGRETPISLILHAGTDLYRDRVYLEKKLLYADNIFLVCEFNRQFLQSTYPELFEKLAPKIRIHRLGLDLEAFRFRSEGRDAATVLCVGSLERAKGFDEVLRAVSLLRGRGIPARIEILGDGPEAPVLKRLARELGLSDATRFLGWLAFSDVQAAMSRATLLVHASSDLGDAVPTVIKEAQALGTPVVGTSVAGIPELLDGGRCGVLVPPRDVPALALAMESLLREPDRARELAMAARRHVEKNLDLWANGRALAERLRETVRRREEPSRGLLSSCS